MPWTVADVDKHKKGLSAKDKRQWVAIANSVLKKCMADGGSESVCAAKAIRQANGVAGNEAVLVHHLIKVNDYIIRNVRHQGHDTIVVPVVMMVEGVHNGSHGPLYHSAEELGRFIQTWNGIPVVIHHPQRDGVNISANDPEVIDGQTVGRIYNAYMDGPKLKAEAWIDLERVREVSPEVLALIQAQRPLDVSVGVFSEDELTPGTWNGEQYVGVARGHRPDHLALLPGGTGACSWADGCGVRANAEEGGEDKVPASKISVSLDLDTSQANQELDSLLEKANAIKGAIGEAEDNKKPTHESTDAKPDLFKSFKDFGAGEFTIVRINADMGYRELLSKIQGVLDRMDNNSKVHFLQEVYSDTVVYEVMPRDGGPAVFYKQDYEVNDKGEVTLTGNATPVVRQIQFVAVNSNETADKGGTIMADEKKPCCPEKVKLLIDSEHTPFEEVDKSWLELLDMGQIDKLVAMERTAAVKPEPAPAPASEKKEETPATITNEQAVQTLRAQYKTPEEFITNVLPEEMRESLTSGLTLHNAERTRLIEIVKAADAFTADELKTKTMAELGKLAKMVKPHDYSGVTGGQRITDHKSDVSKMLLPAGVVVNNEGR